MADQWLDIDGISYHFDATGALIEYTDASGKVTAVSSDTASTPSPIRWWAIGGGAVLVILAGVALVLRRRG